MKVVAPCCPFYLTWISSRDAAVHHNVRTINHNYIPFYSERQRSLSKCDLYCLLRYFDMGQCTPLWSVDLHPMTNIQNNLCLKKNARYCTCIQKLVIVIKRNLHQHCSSAVLLRDSASWIPSWGRTHYNLRTSICSRTAVCLREYCTTQWKIENHLLKKTRPLAKPRPIFEPLNLWLAFYF